MQTLLVFLIVRHNEAFPACVAPAQDFLEWGTLSTSIVHFYLGWFPFHPLPAIGLDLPNGLETLCYSWDRGHARSCLLPVYWGHTLRAGTAAFV